MMEFQDTRLTRRQLVVAPREAPLAYETTLGHATLLEMALERLLAGDEGLRHAFAIVAMAGLLGSSADCSEEGSSHQTNSESMAEEGKACRLRDVQIPLDPERWKSYDLRKGA